MGIKMSKNLQNKKIDKLFIKSKNIMNTKKAMNEFTGFFFRMCISYSYSPWYFHNQIANNQRILLKVWGYIYFLIML